MWIRDKNIDNGRAFDWGNISSDYAKYRDIYPPKFYNKIIDRNLCINGQKILDVGTGSGVLPRNMYKYGGKWVGTDISQNQIAQAKILSGGMNIDYFAIPTENICFPDNSFDVITSCQCFWYFDHKKVSKIFYDILKPNGYLLILYMAWLPFEDKIAGESEKLVLKYNPEWTGAGETMHPIGLPEYYKHLFDIVYTDEYKINVHFTRDSWNGRMKACRGIGAALSDKEIESWETEHKKLLSEIAPVEFDVLHYCAMLELKSKKF